MNETKYLVDNNALVALKGSRIRSEFFRTYCRVTADVLWEASENPEQAVLKSRANDFTPSLFEQIRVVMKTVEVGDTGLVDLYKNMGAADPGLIASVLDEVTADDGKFFSDNWVLVTNDHAIERKAAELGLVTIKPAELARLIDASTHPEAL